MGAETTNETSDTFKVDKEKIVGTPKPESAEASPIPDDYEEEKPRGTANP